MLGIAILLIRHYFVRLVVSFFYERSGGFYLDGKARII